MENLLSNQPTGKQYSYFLNCDWPAVKFLYYGTSAIFTSAGQLGARTLDRKTTDRKRKLGQ